MDKDYEILINVKIDLEFQRPLPIKTLLKVGVYGYGKREREYNEIREALNEFRTARWNSDEYCGI
jgi:hypothetical protein